MFGFLKHQRTRCYNQGRYNRLHVGRSCGRGSPDFSGRFRTKVFILYRVVSHWKQRAYLITLECTAEGDGVSERANEAEFVNLYARYQNDLFRYVATLVPHLQDAEDVLAEVALALWGSFGEFDRSAEFLPWARQFAYLRVLKYYRARNRRFMLPQRLLEKLASDVRFREKPVDQRLVYLDECRKKLASPDRELLDQRYVKRQRVQDIAKRSSQSANAISKSLGRIRRLLLSCIEQRIASCEVADRLPEHGVGEGHG